MSPKTCTDREENEKSRFERLVSESPPKAKPPDRPPAPVGEESKDTNEKNGHDKKRFKKSRGL
ncbi:hypothetical protein ANCCAN_25246 [Ancylostoma caninum]|uniref:Uncharacterized protein n=1 Tax=Ancylostoma caninum TaxID=29170 RepID=A0A368FDC3_ANCCA|nr:hypothetical protein ANCCAN_25246 [Ancylostoma caninum]